MNGVQHRQLVATLHGNAVAPRGHAAPAVLHADDDFAFGAVAPRGRPVECGQVVVTGGVKRVDVVAGRERQARRGLHDLPEELGAVCVIGLDIGRPGLARNGSWQRQRLGADVSCGVCQRIDRVVWQRQHGRNIGQRRGIDAVAEVEFDQGGAARRGAKA